MTPEKALIVGTLASLAALFLTPATSILRAAPNPAGPPARAFPLYLIDRGQPSRKGEISFTCAASGSAITATLPPTLANSVISGLDLLLVIGLKNPDHSVAYEVDMQRQSPGVFVSRTRLADDRMVPVSADEIPFLTGPTSEYYAVDARVQDICSS
jgi:hypothetical protein